MLNFFLVPTTKKFSWKHVFEVDASSATLLNYLQVARDALSGLDKASPAEAFELLDSYSPHIWSLFSYVINIKTSGGSIKIKKVPDIKWKSSVTKNSIVFESKSVYLETTMVFFGKASALFSSACALVKTITPENYEETIKTISAKIKKAASIWKFLGDSILSNITSLPEEFCPELSIELCEAMVSYCAAALDEITVSMGLLKGTSPALLAKIAAGAAVNAHDAAFKIEACPVNYMLCSELKDTLTYMAAYNNFRSYVLLAMDAKSREDHAMAVSYTAAAKGKLTEKSVKKVSSKIVKAYAQSFKFEMDMLNKIVSDYEMENNHIYYQKITDASELASADIKSVASFETAPAPSLLWSNLNLKLKKEKEIKEASDETVKDSDFLTFGEFTNPNLTEDSTNKTEE